VVRTQLPRDRGNFWAWTPGQGQSYLTPLTLRSGWVRASRWSYFPLVNTLLFFYHFFIIFLSIYLVIPLCWRREAEFRFIAWKFLYLAKRYNFTCSIFKIIWLPRLVGHLTFEGWRTALLIPTLLSSRLTTASQVRTRKEWPRREIFYDGYLQSVGDCWRSVSGRGPNLYTRKLPPFICWKHWYM